jgi:hypothetical protein
VAAGGGVVAVAGNDGAAVAPVVAAGVVAPGVVAAGVVATANVTGAVLAGSLLHDAASSETATIPALHRSRRPIIECLPW